MLNHCLAGGTPISIMHGAWIELAGANGLYKHHSGSMLISWGRRNLNFRWSVNRLRNGQAPISENTYGNGTQSILLLLYYTSCKLAKEVCIMISNYKHHSNALKVLYSISNFYISYHIFIFVYEIQNQFLCWCLCDDTEYCNSSLECTYPRPWDFKLCCGWENINFKIK